MFKCEKFGIYIKCLPSIQGPGSMFGTVKTKQQPSNQPKKDTSR